MKIQDQIDTPDNLEVIVEDRDRELVYINSPDDLEQVLVAPPEMVRNGYMVNVPVTLVFPSGDREDCIMAKVTPEGLKWLDRNLPSSMREGAIH